MVGKRQEVIIAGNGKLVLDKEPRLFGRAATYDTNLLEDMRVDASAPAWKGRIVFGQRDKAVYFAAHIDAEEAEELLLMIRKGVGNTTG